MICHFCSLYCQQPLDFLYYERLGDCEFCAASNNLFSVKTKYNNDYSKIGAAIYINLYNFFYINLISPNIITLLISYDNTSVVSNNITLANAQQKFKLYSSFQ